MSALPRPLGRALALSRQATLKPVAILRLQITALQQGAPLKTCNIVGGAIIRLTGAVLLEANDEWQLQHRYMQTEAMAELIPPLLDVVPAQISTVAA